MNLAPLPDHNRTDDLTWQRLFAAYRHLITPLRRNGWCTDVELCGNQYHLRADLGDGTELIIATSDSLPANRADADGWMVTRHPVEEGGTHTVVYDSTPEGPQRHHGTSLVPLFQRLDQLDACTTTARLYVSASTTDRNGITHNQYGPTEKPGTASARFGDWATHLTGDGWHHVHEQGDGPDPVDLFEKNGSVTIVRLNPAHD